MIDELHIYNFQSQKETHLFFDKGVNIIVGSTDSGKTAILRALNWLFNNKPGGDAFVSNWADKTMVWAKVNGHTITRIKGPSTNLYMLDDLEFFAFGSNVPDEIKKVLNISEINLQQQLDSPFLLTKSSGEVAKHFNRIAKLNKIDEANSYIKKSINLINTTIEIKEKSIKSNEDKLSKYPDLDLIEVELETTEDLEIQRNQLSKSISSLSKLIDDIELTNKKIELIEPNLKFEDQISKLCEMVETKNNETKSYNALKSIIKSIEETSNEITEKEILTNLEKRTNNLLQLIATKNEIRANLDSLTTLIGKIKAVDKTLLEKQENVVSLESTFHDEMGDICILCGSKIHI